MNTLRVAVEAALLVVILTVQGCYVMRPSSGGGETSFSGARTVRAADVALPRGYRIDVVATGLTFPTGVAFDDAGTPYVTESGYSYGEVFTVPRLLRINADRSVTEVARGTNNGPWTGVARAGGAFIVAEGGTMQGGRILRVALDGRITALIENLPTRGDHHTNGPAIASDGSIYFGQGVATNSGVVGEDNLQFGWLKREPAFHDVPCRDVTLAGRNFATADLLGKTNGKVETGAFSPFGTPTSSGQVIKGQVPCSGAILRIPPNGGNVELVAWGLRNPFGMAFAPDGQLYVTENGYDDRGSRPVWGAPDALWRITPGTWYGWPDFAGGIRVDQPAFKPPGKAQPEKLLATMPNPPPRPVALLGVHASSDGFDFSRSANFGHVGEAFIAEFGDESPTTGKSLHPVGFRVIRVNVQTGEINDFAVNRGHENGPGTKIGSAGFERPVAARFDPRGDALYVVDFGVLLQDKSGAKPQQKTGVLWKITRE